MKEDTLIAVIRLLRKTGLLGSLVRLTNSKSAVILIAVLLVGVSSGAFMLLSSGGDASDSDVKGLVTVSENPSDGTVTFTLSNNSSVDKVLLKGISDEPIELTEPGQSYTTESDKSVIVSAVVGESEYLVRTYDPGSKGGLGDGEAVELNASFSAEPESAYPDESISLDASDSTVPSGANVTYSWTLGDGANATGQTISHRYAEAGTYTVTLTVTANETTSSANTTLNIVAADTPTAKMSGPTEGTTSMVLSFDASGASDPQNSQLTYEWDFGDGTTGEGLTTRHEYSRIGEFDVTLTVTNEWGKSDSTTQTVIIRNQGPDAAANIPNSGVIGNVISFDASDSTDPDNQSLSYQWEFGDGNYGSGAQATHQFQNAGTYTVEVVVTDSEGAADIYRGQIAIAESTSGGDSGGDDASTSGPTAELSGPTSGDINETLTFDASGSYDSDGDVLSYSWDFGDGTTVSDADPSVTHKFGDDLSYTVMVTVTDGNTTDTDTMSVSIQNSPPTASAAANSTTTHTGTPVVFNASASSDPNDQPLSYEWAFEDGAVLTGAEVRHQFDSLGSYNVTLTATDPEGANDSTELTIEVVNRPPIADVWVENTTGTVDDAFSFDAGNSTDPEGQSLSHSWNFDDGTTVTGVSPTHQFDAVGTYNVSLTTTDTEGDSNTTTTTITIENRPPVADAWSGKTNASVGETISFDGLNSSDPDNQSLSYEWDLDSDGVYEVTGATVNHSFETSGTYNVSLLVIDSERSMDSETLELTITNEPPTARIDANQTTVETGDDILFDAGNSTDPEGQTLSYQWVFGDGDGATSERVVHNFTDSGTYEVTLVVDDGEHTDSTTVNITVNPRTIVDDGFEDGAFDGWTVINGGWNVTSGGAYAGTNKLISNGTGPQVIQYDSTLVPHDTNIETATYVEAGGNGSAVIDFAVVDSTSYYRVLYTPSGTANATFALQKISGGGSVPVSAETLASVSPSTGAGTWISVTINRTADGDTYVTAYTASTNTTESLYALDSSYTGDGYFRLGARDDTQTRYDNVTALDD